MADLTKSELDRRRSAGGQRLHDVKVIVVRMTEKAYLLSAAKADDEITGAACWFAKSLVDLGCPDEEAMSTKHCRGLIAVMPEWLLIEKGWENYVEASR